MTIAPSSLLKSYMNNSIAEGIYNEITNRTARYYYFLGKTLTWEDDANPPFPIDSFNYELQTRNEMITFKEIKPTDIAFVVPKYNWELNTVYDMYDDQYSKEVQGFNLISGGLGYSSTPNVWVGSAGAVTWTANTILTAGAFIRVSNGNGGFRYYIVATTGTTGTTAPTHTDGTASNGSVQFTHVVVTDGGGTGAAAEAVILDGKVIDVILVERGINYTSLPSVHIAGGQGNGAISRAVVTIAPSGAQRLEQARFYVVTDEFNVYKCLDNNNNSASQFKPSGTTVDPVTFPDGYMWKFIYNIPIALRTKFLTNDFMPVVTALNNQFYSNGNLQSIRIDQTGSGYTTGTITVQGDGFLEADPIYITGGSVALDGSGYTTATLVVQPPFTNVSSWLANTLILQGQRLSFNSNIYEVAVSGVTGNVGPVHRYDIVANGTAALKYIGTTITGDLEITAGEITDVTLYGIIRDIQIISNGSGYTSAPTINITGGGGTGSNAVAVLQNGSVIQAIVTNGGDDFTSAPTVTFGDIWTATTEVTIGEQYYFSNRLYTVTVAGTTGSSAPVHLSGTAINSALFAFSTALTLNSTVYVSNRLYKVTTAGTTSLDTTPTHTTGTVTNGTAALLYLGTPATLQYVGLPATGVASLKYGAGYSSIPNAAIVGNTGSSGAEVIFTSVKSEAKLVPIFESGQLVDVQIDDGGVGYTNVNLTVAGNGTGAAISANLSPGDVDSLQANTELLTLDGRIMSCPIISGGFGYVAATVTIEGDGTGAEAVAVIENGAIKKIRITSYGENYRYARVTISGNGFGAKARPVITPYGGHGKFAINGLFARTLMFYTNISGDKNQGFDVNNDYRQLGILKNPRKYNSTNSAVSISGSACFVVSGSISTTFFPADSIVRESVGSKRFRVVTNTGNAALLQSLDNFVPQIGTTFVNDGSFTFVASAVTLPTVDKYSGDLLFIDNRQGFTPTIDQSVTLRTILRF